MTRKTRSDGEGSIYPREDGKWVASISMGKDHTGKRMRKTRIASSKKQASIKLREMQEMARNNTLVVDDTITISGFSDLWIETILPSQVDRSNSPNVPLRFATMGASPYRSFPTRGVHLTGFCAPPTNTIGFRIITCHGSSRTKDPISLPQSSSSDGKPTRKPSECHPPNTFTKFRRHKNKETLTI